MTQHFEPSSKSEIAEGVHATAIDGLFYLPHRKFEDHRGFYSELSRVPEIEAVTKQPFIIKQLNLSHSKQNVIRGFHAERWNKLLTIVDGICFCAWADFREDSPTFGEVVTMTVGQEDEALFGSVFVSSGIGNSFCVIKGPANYLYAVDKLYAERDPKDDIAVNLFDTDLSVEWPLPTSTLILSERDKQSVSLRQAFPSKFQ